MTPVTTPVAHLIGRTVPRHSLSDAERSAMFGLLSTFFTGVDAETFAADLEEKNHVILLQDESGVLRGFSTLLVYTSHILEADVTVVYSGDTIVDREWWGSPALAVSWLRAARGLASAERQAAGATNPEVYWLLLTSGFRTYRFLPVFWKDFYPRYDLAGGPKALLDALAIERFGSSYDQSRGIVRFAKPQVLVPELLDVPSGRTIDAHVAFFLERNPGFVNGDELACLTRIDDDGNLTAAGRRIARLANAIEQPSGRA